MKSERILCLISGLILAYFAVYLGDWVNVLFHTSSGLVPLIVIISAGVAVVGIILLFMSLSYESISTLDRVFYLIVGPSFVAYAFGVVSAPVTTIGFAPWTWITPWSILLVLACLPSLFALRSIIFDLPGSVSNR